MTQQTTKIAGRAVTRAAVLAAMDEADRLGLDAFLKLYGFGRSSRYWIRGPRSARAYPSKAILGRAAEATKAHGYAGQDCGGAAHTVRAARQLGFEIREGDKPVTAAGLDALREQAIREGLADPCPEWDELSYAPVAYFASGSNRPGEIRGLAAVRHDVGVAAQHVSATSEGELVALAGTDVQVFVDSGAFSEVEFNRETFRMDVVRPLTDADWDERLGLYERLADALGEQVWLVAPDQIGSQEVTLERLARYADRLQKIAASGAKLLVVAQKGALDQASFYRAAIDAAGLRECEGRTVTAALPCKKAATTALELAAFVRDAKPTHVHLLGMGAKNRKIHDYVAALGGTSYSLDSCWITANVGRGRGKRRPYTKAQDAAAQLLAGCGRIAGAASKLASDVVLKLELALRIALGAPLPQTSVVPVKVELGQVSSVDGLINMPWGLTG